MKWVGRIGKGLMRIWKPDGETEADVSGTMVETEEEASGTVVAKGNEACSGGRFLSQRKQGRFASVALSILAPVETIRAGLHCL